MSTELIYKTVTTSSEDTEKLGLQLAGLITPPLLIELRADLGGGKTTLVKGIVKGLKSESVVSSPTFTLQRTYKGYLPDSSHLDVAQGDDEQRTSRTSEYDEGVAQADDEAIRQKPAGARGSAPGQGGAMRDVWVHHYDFYRLEDAGILKDQIAESIAQDNVITIVEWSDIVESQLPNSRLSIELKPTASNPDEREIAIKYPEKLAGQIRQLEEIRAENR